QHKEARLIPSEAATADNEEKAVSRQAAVAAGKKTPEEIEAAFTATPKPWLKTLAADIESSIAALKKLDDVSSAKFGNLAPSYARLRETIQDVQRIAVSQLKHKLELDPDPVEVNLSASGDGNATTSAGSAAVGASLSAEPTSRDDATARIIGAARYL